MIHRANFQNNDEIGCYSRLTNTYCLVTYGQSQEFVSVFEAALSDYIPVVQTSIFNTTTVGTLSAGNRHGLLVPMTTSDQELQHLRNSLPDSVKIQRVEERLSALGNVISCNDYMALIHPELDTETQYIIEDVLQVDVIRHKVSDYSLVGTYTKFNNKGGIVHPLIKAKELKELSDVLGIPLVAGTINRGSPMVGSGIVLNDWALFCGSATTSAELSIIKIFRAKLRS
ncbi:Eukaryotic translation initiation factor 6 [Thelohanellus kitauei]|uniref:Eukaryotic translation initiation factor 6 n=1 Tax=Thelohanellus kitauei TaxID=669202 RepID=A0A0C2N3F7_THEKT|nr:Eukaryotic translation initiation factor 6 [Thelohanellus kitauei]